MQMLQKLKRPCPRRLSKLVSAQNSLVELVKSWQFTSEFSVGAISTSGGLGSTGLCSRKRLGRSHGHIKYSYCILVLAVCGHGTVSTACWRWWWALLLVVCVVRFVVKNQPVHERSKRAITSRQFFRYILANIIACSTENIWGKFHQS